MLDLKHIKVDGSKKISLKDYDPGYTCDYKDKDEAEEKLEDDIKELQDLQYKLYAENQYAVLMVLQAADAAGKDGAIKHVMSGINPQGCQVTAFKQPSSEELEHDFLWRCSKALPERGRIGVFNRSHYEEVLVTKVHPQIIINQRIPGIDTLDKIDHHFWKSRYKRINNFEEHLHASGTVVIKYFLHLSKDEQKERFLSRIEDTDKNWKFSASDIKERAYWDDYIKAFEEMINHTSTEHAPWYIIPADKKWFSRTAIGDILVRTIRSLDPQIPKMDPKEKDALLEARDELARGKA